MTDKEQNNSDSGFFAIGEVFSYFFRKKDPTQKKDLNLRMMHGINKFTIIAFLLGVTYFIIKKTFLQ
jgi:Ni,Fe-hydrogenase I cytochrome b subunit